MQIITYDAEGNVLSVENADDPATDNAQAALEAVAALRAHAASLSPTGATRKALEAAADALEALLGE